MEDLENETLSADELRAAQALRSLPGAMPDPEFQARLHDQFVSGEFQPARARVLHLPWHRRPMTYWTLATAAVVTIVAGLLELNQGEAWRVISAHGEGTMLVDGRPVEFSSRANLDALFRTGTDVVMPEASDVTLRSGDVMLVVITPSSEITVPSVPGRWFGRTAVGGVSSGELRLTTGESFRGASLLLQTPNAQVHVTGTTLAVICELTGTCVCVLEGTAHVGRDRRSTSELVTAGTLGYVFNNSRPMMHAEMRPGEVPALGALRDSGHQLLNPRGARP